MEVVSASGTSTSENEPMESGKAHVVNASVSSTSTSLSSYSIEAKRSVEIQTETTSMSTEFISSAEGTGTQTSAEDSPRRRPTTVLWVSSNSVSFDDPKSDPVSQSAATNQQKRATVCLTVLPKELINKKEAGEHEVKKEGADSKRRSEGASRSGSGNQMDEGAQKGTIIRQSKMGPSPAPPIVSAQLFVTKRSKGLMHSSSMKKMPRMGEEMEVVANQETTSEFTVPRTPQESIEGTGSGCSDSVDPMSSFPIGRPAKRRVESMSSSESDSCSEAVSFARSLPHSMSTSQIEDSSSLAMRSDSTASEPGMQVPHRSLFLKKRPPRKQQAVDYHSDSEDVPPVLPVTTSVYEIPQPVPIRCHPLLVVKPKKHTKKSKKSHCKDAVEGGAVPKKERPSKSPKSPRNSPKPKVHNNCEVSTPPSSKTKFFDRSSGFQTPTSTSTNGSQGLGDGMGPGTQESAESEPSVSLYETPKWNPSLTPVRSHLRPAGANTPVEQRKKLRWNTVDVYFFERQQGVDTVPTSGEVCLGMQARHHSQRTFTLTARGGQPFIGIEVEEEELSSGEEEPFIERYTAKYLAPIHAVRQRCKMLKGAGIQIDKTATSTRELELLRERRRAECGCRCRDGICVPETCECALEGIKCQVDEDDPTCYPCVCTKDFCTNPIGRVEFDRNKVHEHHVATMMRLKAMERVGVYVTPTRRRLDSEEERTSYLETPPPTLTPTNSCQKSALQSTSRAPEPTPSMLTFDDCTPPPVKRAEEKMDTLPAQATSTGSGLSSSSSTLLGTATSESSAKLEGILLPATPEKKIPRSPIKPPTTPTRQQPLRAAASFLRLPGVSPCAQADGPDAPQLQNISLLKACRPLCSPTDSSSKAARGEPMDVSSTLVRTPIHPSKGLTTSSSASRLIPMNRSTSSLNRAASASRLPQIKGRISTARPRAATDTNLVCAPVSLPLPVRPPQQEVLLPVRPPQQKVLQLEVEEPDSPKKELREVVVTPHRIARQLEEDLRDGHQVHRFPVTPVYTRLSGTRASRPSSSLRKSTSDVCIGASPKTRARRASTSEVQGGQRRTGGKNGVSSVPSSPRKITRSLSQELGIRLVDGCF